MGNLTVDGLPSIQEQGFGLSQVISSPTLALSPPPTEPRTNKTQLIVKSQQPISVWQYHNPRPLLLHHLAAGSHRTPSPIHEEFKSATCTFYPSADLQATIPTNPEVWDNCFPYTNVSKGLPEAYTHTIR
ncbi:unnamed protein product [Parnassius mnemosyne]|uniref:Uncharacterized protein n=1 Tax=Parnassius mnemosyne TaxID=213953 RepID=A0AAV1LJN5_9NEOP